MKSRLDNNYPCSSAVKWDWEILKKDIHNGREGCLPTFGLKRVEIQPTSLCQYNCSFCYGVNFKDKCEKYLSLDVIENNILKSIRDNDKLSCDNPLIILSGLYSEPLLYPYRVKLIKLLGDYGFRFAIYTNGVLLDDDTMEIICESAGSFKDDEASYISFNLTGSVENNKYEEMMSKVKRLIEMRNGTDSNLQINIPILLEGGMFSQKDLSRIQNELLGIGVDKIRYSVPQVAVSGGETVDVTNVKFLNNLKKGCGDRIYIRSKSNKKFDRCYVMANTVSINYRGDVYPCSQTCSPLFKTLSYGSILNKGVADVWNSKEHRNLFCNFEENPTYCRCNSLDSQFNSVCTTLDIFK